MSQRKPYIINTKQAEAMKAQKVQGTEWKKGESILDFKTEASQVWGWDSLGDEVPVHSLILWRTEKSHLR